MTGFATGWREHFTLRHAVSLARAEAPEVLRERGVLVACAAQKLAAADALRPLGQRGEALALVVAALGLLVESAGVGSTLAALVTLGVSSADEIATRLVHYAGRAPVFDAKFSGDDESAHRRLRAAASQAIGPSAVRARSARDLRIVAITRSLSALALLLVSCVAAALLLVPRPRVLVTPSAIHGPAYSAANATDGDPATEWLLPDNTAGFMELRLLPARAVSRVTVLNAHNSPFNDRGTKAWTIELWRGAEKVATRDGEWAFTPTPTPTVVPLSAAGVDRIRFVLKSHHQFGAGIAEISFQ